MEAWLLWMATTELLPLPAREFLSKLKFLELNHFRWGVVDGSQLKK